MARLRPQTKSAFKEATNEIEQIQSMINSKDSIVEIPLSLIVSPKTHDRKCFDEKEIQELSDSIKKSGLLQPIVVRKKGTQFERLIGFKRVMATKLLDATAIKAIVLSDITDEQASLITISENLYRSDPNVYDQTLAFLDYASIALGVETSNIIKLLNKYKASRELSEDEMSSIQILEDVVSKNLSIKLRTLADRVKILNINSILIEAIQKREVTYQEAIAIDKLSDNSKIKDLLLRVKEEELTLSDIKKIVSQALKIKPSQKENDYTKIFSKSLIKSVSKLSADKQSKIDMYVKKIQELLEKNINEE